MTEARFYKTTEDGAECLLCPRHCRIREGGRGACRSRVCRNGKLYALSYGRPCALAVDPVEKKPLNYFLPGTRCLSLSCTGCNLACRWCQNSDISQAVPEAVESSFITPEQMVELCLQRGLPSVAYTYTEPFTWWEYMHDIAYLAHQAGLKNILVSAGYVEKEPLNEILPFLDAANIDIKAMDEEICRKYCGVSPGIVLENILSMRDAGVHLELTNLLVTGVNDSEKQITDLCAWMADNHLQDVPLHFSRFFPRYRFTGVGPTPKAALLNARDIALNFGIKTVHLGNI